MEVNRRALLLGGAALAAPVLIGRPAAAATTLKLAHLAAESHPGHKAALQMKEAVERRSEGALKIEIFPANQLGAPPEQLEQTKLGVIDMNLPTQGALDKYEKAFATVMAPFIFKDRAHVFAVLDGPFAAWTAPLLEKQGLVQLASWDYGFRNITNSRRPIMTPDDVKGLRIRTPPEVQLVACIEALGARATQIAFTELPSALNQGVVDGQENPVSVIWHMKLHETQPHLALTRHAYNSLVHVINRRRWQSLSASQQEILREESTRAAQAMRRLDEEEEASDLSRIEAAGVKITKPDLAPFRAQMEPAYKRVASYAGEDNMKRMLKIVQDAAA
ncbi:TRAP transporter substrate-binding protein [Roseomonas sp. M0104]|uniref:TRAP transporter substrate-binding protein n=1 Tax=Teichococcus coralli TaxID=2545983 RepID=A0A845BET4_9PROT|nr:TRAP transporter substrate-binding protein [Pseudoroseomonas coralli]MXP65328.1 TRAP transporter substrate-binding protein [Pseudoroseomonas coralli]